MSDDRGVGTVWGLMWFILTVGICGLAADITDGFRAQTMLQATADSAALAGSIELPDEAAAVSTAVAYSQSNMPTDEYGTVLASGDVEVGSWDMGTHIFTAGGLVPDAVRVTVRRSIENENPVPVSFLRIIGLYNWNVTTYAIAQRFIPECLTDGLVARGIVDISSNNNFVGEMCVHGQQGVAMQNHNYHEAGVTVSMPDMNEQLVIPARGMDGNPGLPEALREQSLDPRMVNHVDELIAGLLDRAAYVLPAYVDASQPVIAKTEKWNFADLTPGRIYHIQCAANKNVRIPNDLVLSEVVIVSDCQVGVGSGVMMSDVVLASRGGGNPGGGGSNGSGNGGSHSGAGGPGVENANITFSANVQLGAADDCQPGGGVQIFSNASVQFSSSMLINGLQVVAAGDVDLGARDEGINGINVQAGGDITLTSNNAFGLCTGGAPDLFTVPYYRLVF